MSRPMPHSAWMTLREPYWLRVTHATIALLALAAAPAYADGLSGVFAPPIGLPLTLAIAALEAPILARIIGGRRPWLVSFAANLLSAAAGFGVVAIIVLRSMADAPPIGPDLSHFSPAVQDVAFFGTFFLLTLAIEFCVVYACWRKRGLKRVALGVLAANAASYALLIPIMLASQNW